MSSNSHIVLRNAKNEYYEFKLINNSLTVQEFSTSTKNIPVILKDSVTCFSADLSDEDTIFYAYSINSGKLKLSEYSSSNGDLEVISVASGYEITNISFKIISGDYHLFYVIREKAAGQCVIYHSRCHSGIWSSVKITTLKRNTDTPPYLIDTYKKYIYIFCACEALNEYILKRYDTELNNWEEINIHTKLSDSHNLRFLISENGMAFLCHSLSLDDLSQITLKEINLEDNSKNWSEDILLTTHEYDASFPSIVSFENNVYILWEEINLIAYKSIKLPDRNISDKSVLAIISSEIIHSKYISHHDSDKNIKCTSFYMTSDTVPHSIIQYNKISVKSEAPGGLKAEYMSNINTLIENKNREAEDLKRQSINLQRELQYLNKILKSNEDQIQKLKLQIDFNEKKYKTSLDELSKKLRMIEEDKIKLTIEMNKKVESLTSIINEKEKIIRKLNSLINDYNKRFFSKEEGTL